MNTPAPYQDPATIQRVLREANTIAVVGMSSNPLRASHFVGLYASRHGYNVIPVNPREDEILGLKCYPSIAEVPEPIDIVDVFRDPSAVPEIVEDAINADAKALWLQFGVISEAGAKRASNAGMDVVMDKCLKIEHARFQGRMHWLGFNTNVVTARRE